MAVHHHVDLLGLQNAEVHPGPHRKRGPEHHVLQVGGDHRAAPAVGQGRSDAVADDALVVVVHTHVRNVHELHDLAIDAARGDVHSPPQVLPGLRGAGKKLQLPMLLTELGEGPRGHLFGQLGHLLAFGRDAVLLGQGPELLRVLDLVVGRLAAGHQHQGVGYVAAVVRVSRRTRGDHPGQVPGGDRRRRRAAHAALLVLLARNDAAGTHVADAAAQALLSELAARLHGLPAVPGRLDTLLGGLGQHGLRRRVDRPRLVLRLFLCAHECRPLSN